MNPKPPIFKEIQPKRKLIPRWYLNWQLDGWGWRWRGTKIGQIRIPQRLEYEHFLICGATGTGKSTATRHIIHQILARGEPAIIIDPHGELTAEFYDEKNDLLLDPSDRRCPYLGPELEIQDPTDIQAIALAMVRNRQEDSWHLAARRLIAALLTIDASKILSLISLLPKDLHKRLPENAKNIFDPSATNQVSAVLGIASTILEPLACLPPKSERQWCAAEWGIKPKGRIFLTSNERTRATTQKVQGIWLDLLIRELLTNRKGPQTWLIGSELPVMGYQPKIERLLTEGRKYHVSAVIEFQNIAQMRELYGHDGAINIASSPTTQILFNPGNEPETADWIRRVIGNYELDTDVQQLSTGHAYLAIKGYERTRISFKFRNPVERVPAFIPRKALNPALITLATFTDKTQIAREKKRLWAMVQRTTDPDIPAFKNYGGRGVKVRDAWAKLPEGIKPGEIGDFRGDMWMNYILVVHGPCSDENLSWDRINNNGDYRDGNLKRATAKEQIDNRRKVSARTRTANAAPAMVRD